jgi:hypothetical protein
MTTDIGGGPVGAVSLLLKATLGGVACLLVTWIGILVAHFWRIKNYNAKHGTVAGLGASAGGWNSLLQSPIVVILITVAFGIGFYAAVRWSLR